MIPIEYSIQKLSITREEMMAIAQLTGSDYCPGVKGVGPKTARRILGKDFYRCRIRTRINQKNLFIEVLNFHENEAFEYFPKSLNI